MLRTGPNNLITDVAGLKVGHASDDRVGTGATVLLFDTPFAAAVDIGGGGPGVRETETLAPENLVNGIDAIVLSGGSVFGLGAADGVAAWLSARGIGLRLRPDGKAIPIVPAGVLHDLTSLGDKDWGETPPYRVLGREAAQAATASFELGAEGAGKGAKAGHHKGGIGSASIALGEGAIVGALAAVNSVGSVFMPDGESFWSWPFEIDGEFGNRPPPGRQQAHDPIPDECGLSTLGKLSPGGNTTLAVVATDVRLDKGELKRVAMMAQDGIARAIRPAHTPFDGDLVFAVSNGAIEADTGLARALTIARIGSAAADCLARAIARGVYEARE